MSVNLIGRNREVRELNELYDSGKAELVAVYGRRHNPECLESGTLS